MIFYFLARCQSWRMEQFRRYFPQDLDLSLTVPNISQITRQHALIFPPAQTSDDTTVYLFTDAQCDMHTSLCLLLRNDSAKRHIFGCSCSKPALGLMTPKFEIERDFGTMHIATKFHHPTLIPYTFNRSEVMVLTNKLTTNRTPL